MESVIALVAFASRVLQLCDTFGSPPTCPCMQATVPLELACLLLFAVAQAAAQRPRVAASLASGSLLG